ncbi:hypothetical protein PV379_29705 [Streptomyces caniscabiei]|uniref:hypothetical protein n=1 Tax=Streptomyces caniscabiei TaxID=2746961 RepID=UPI0029BD5B01|nr:hypothetical protein [Streptomyces caniscabiei]MDX2781446.1 hypothetical protein [Streptomyces caniscabiei]
MARVAAIAENAGFTLITVDDGVLPPGAAPDPVGRIGAVERAAFVAASTRAAVGCRRRRAGPGVEGRGGGGPHPLS